MMWRLAWLGIVLALAACATPARWKSSVDPAAVEECHAFAEQSVPHEPVSNYNGGGGRSTVYPSRDAGSLKTVFDLCMQAKEALK